MSIQEKYDDAYKNAKNLKGGDQQDQLDFYGWAKVASGADFAEAKRPGGFDFQGKYKYGAWEKVVMAGLSKERAQEEYVKRFEELKNKHGLKA
ncbi:gb [Venturia nashicola]|uniref:Gb n=1 Tax=Venturia nashicola TaxID=86259 RepID=A0A4Z1P8W0_9PEZI|nr:gb [Venturia nashicola]TLD36074.1 gb [Venturia nashicola]